MVQMVHGLCRHEQNLMLMMSAVSDADDTVRP